MRHTKQEVIEDIRKIPQFQLRGVAVDDSGSWIGAENYRAVTEVGSLEPLAFPTIRYKLIQLSEVFLPLVEPIPELEGGVTYYKGVGILDIFPKDDKLEDEYGRIGLVALNSVDCSCSVVIKFCVLRGNRVYTLPHRIAGFKKVHTGKALQLTQDFMNVIDKVRVIWKQIVDEFGKIPVDKEYAAQILEDIGIKGNYMLKRVHKQIDRTPGFNLWDLFITLLEIGENRKSKSDYHQRHKADVLTEKLLKYAVASKLINA